MANPRRPNEFLTEPYSYPWEHPANADGGSVEEKLDVLTRRVKITRVKYVNKTGLAEHAANFATLQVKNGATVVASWTTDSGSSASDVSIPADTFIELTLATDDADLIFAAGDVLSFVVAEAGTTTVPAGRVVIEGIYI